MQQFKCLKSCFLNTLENDCNILKHEEKRSCPYSNCLPIQFTSLRSLFPQGFLSKDTKGRTENPVSNLAFSCCQNLYYIINLKLIKILLSNKAQTYLQLYLTTLAALVLRNLALKNKLTHGQFLQFMSVQPLSLNNLPTQ